jgi:drug/metabolite transporter (DMT)-like permease
MNNKEPAQDRAGPAGAFGLSATTEAYALLTFTAAAWGGNAVAGRLVVGEVSPMVVTSLRWAIVAVVLLVLRPLQLVTAWPALRRSWRKIAVMAACGFSIFNALFYLSAHYTTGVNIAILQGAIPVFVVIGAVVLFGSRLGPIQVCGIAATLIGVAVVATQGHLATLAAFRLNFGDGLMILACLLYAGYTLALRDRPDVPALAFFTALAAIAFLTSLPLVAYEMAAGTVQWPTAKGWAILLYIALFPSFLAQLSFMRGVRLIGPGRAGLFANLVPIFGAFLAVLILQESFGLFHLAALVLVIGGILVAETSERRRAKAAAGPTVTPRDRSWPRD